MVTTDSDTTGNIKRQAEEYAGERDDGWNERFIAFIEGHGHRIVPLPAGSVAANDGPVLAPEPCELGKKSKIYKWPSVIAANGWSPYSPDERAAKEEEQNKKDRAFFEAAICEICDKWKAEGKTRSAARLERISEYLAEWI